MKNLLITYHMVSANENAETCITLPMAAEVAASVLTYGDESQYIRYGGTVRKALEAIARMQGYQFDCFCCAEEVR